MKTIVTIAAIRPDYIRLSALIEKLDNSDYNHILVSTGQHYDTNLVDIFLEDLSIRKPDYVLTSGAPGRQAWEQIYACGSQLLELMAKIKPDLIIYLGDSNSVASAFALKRAGYKIARVEALMRAYSSIQTMCKDGGCPLPEELNRKVADSLSDILFTYHSDYMSHAKTEGIPLSRVFVVGNTIKEVAEKYFDEEHVSVGSHICVDIHREENISSPDRLKFILDAARTYSRQFGVPAKMLDFSRTTEAIRKNRLDIKGIEFVPLMNYRDYMRFQRDSIFVFSDSGSAAEECPLLGVACVSPRTTTERPQSIRENCSILLSMDERSLARSIEWLKDWTKENAGTAWLGDGNTSQLILDVLIEKDGKLWSEKLYENSRIYSA